MTTDLIDTQGHPYALIPNISAFGDAAEPDPSTETTPDLSEHVRLSFLRTPASPAAEAVVSAVVELIRPHLGARAQAAGKKGQARLKAETGIILAGLLSAHHRSKVVAVPRDMKAKLWKTAPLGFRALWAKVDAMIAAGLIGTRLGIGYVNAWGAQAGEATRIWPLQRLIALAVDHGCTPATLRQDWPVTRTGDRRELTRHELVTFSPLRKGAGGRGGTHLDPQPGTDRLFAFVGRLNAMAATATVTGCCPPVVQRKYAALPTFGGRFYAKGADSFQSISRDERASIRINGEPVVEADLSASYLSIFLALVGAPAPMGDPYALAGLRNVPREAVKQWFMQTMQTGELCPKWSKDAPPEARNVLPSRIACAAVTTYPALSGLASWLPQGLRRGVLPSELGWAGAMHLQAIESDVIADTMAALMDAGCVVLPLHDAVLVPASWAQRAADELQQAFTVRIGRPGIVKLKDPSAGNALAA